MKASFSELFDVVDERVVAKVPVSYNGASVNTGENFAIGEGILGVDLSGYIDKYFEVLKDESGYHIQGFYD